MSPAHEILDLLREVSEAYPQRIIALSPNKVTHASGSVELVWDVVDLLGDPYSSETMPIRIYSPTKGLLSRSPNAEEALRTLLKPIT